MIQVENNIIIWSEVKTTNDLTIHECRDVKMSQNKEFFNNCKNKSINRFLKALMFASSLSGSKLQVITIIAMAMLQEIDL